MFYFMSALDLNRLCLNKVQWCILLYKVLKTVAYSATAVTYTRKLLIGNLC